MPLSLQQKKDAAKRAQEMKDKAAAKRKAREDAGGASVAAHADEKFILGEHNLILIDWDDTLFPTTAWRDRMKENPPRASKIQALCEAISGFITTLQKFGTVKIITHGTSGWFAQSSALLLPETKALLYSLDHRYRDSHGGKYMKQKPSGQKYTTDIGVQVDNYVSARHPNSGPQPGATPDPCRPDPPSLGP